MDAGIAIIDDSLTAFNDIKMNKKYRWVIYKIENKKELIVENKGDRDSSWDSFIKLFPKSEQRFGVFDYNFKTNEKPPRDVNKIIFVAWSPDDSGASERMIYASTKEKLKSKLVGINHTVQANDFSDLDEKNLQDALK